MVTNQQVAAAFEIVVLVGQLIRDKGEVPSGELYSQLMGHLDIHQYEQIISKLIQAKVVSRSNHLLTWIGPAAGN